MLQTLSKKKYMIIKLSVLIFFIIQTIAIQVVNAAGSISDFPEYMLDTVKTGASATVLANLSSQGSFYRFVVHGETTLPNVRDCFSAIMISIAIVGLINAIISFAKSVKEISERGLDITEAMFRCSSTFLIMIVLIINASRILDLGTNIGEYIIEAIANNLPITSNDALADLSMKTITGHSNGGILWWIQSTVILIIPYIISLILNIAANFLTFSILLELGIRRILAPLQVVNLMEDGFRGPGMRYLKKYIATFLKVGVCLLVCAFGSVLTMIAMEDVAASMNGGSSFGTTLTDCLNFVLYVVTINLTVVGFMSKGGELANEAMGV